MRRALLVVNVGIRLLGAAGFGLAALIFASLTAREFGGAQEVAQMTANACQEFVVSTSSCQLNTGPQLLLSVLASNPLLSLAACVCGILSIAIAYSAGRTSNSTPDDN